METNNDTPIFLVIDETESWANLELEDSPENLEARRILHEIMLLGRAHPVESILCKNPEGKTLA